MQGGVLRRGWCPLKAHYHGNNQCHLRPATSYHPDHFLLLSSRASGALSPSYSPLCPPPCRADQAEIRTGHFIWPQRARQSGCQQRTPLPPMAPWKWKRVSVDMIPLFLSYFSGPDASSSVGVLRVPPTSVS